MDCSNIQLDIDVIYNKTNY